MYSKIAEGLYWSLDNQFLHSAYLYVATIIKVHSGRILKAIYLFIFTSRKPAFIFPASEGHGLATVPVHPSSCHPPPGHRDRHQPVSENPPKEEEGIRW